MPMVRPPQKKILMILTTVTVTMTMATITITITITTTTTAATTTTTTTIHIYYPGKRPQTAWGIGRIMRDNVDGDDDDDADDADADADDDDDDEDDRANEYDDDDDNVEDEVEDVKVEDDDVEEEENDDVEGEMMMMMMMMGAMMMMTAMMMMAMMLMMQMMMMIMMMMMTTRMRIRMRMRMMRRRMLRRKTDPKTGTHTLREPAQSKWTWRRDLARATLYGKLEEKCRSPDWAQNADTHFVRAGAVETHVKISQGSLYADIYRENVAASWIPQAGPALRASLRNRNAHQHFTRDRRATSYWNLAEKCRSPDWAQNVDTHFVRACTVETHVKISQEPLYMKICG